jgi:hypothetical protein
VDLRGWPCEWTGGPVGLQDANSCSRGLAGRNELAERSPGNLAARKVVAIVDRQAYHPEPDRRVETGSILVGKGDLGVEETPAGAQGENEEEAPTGKRLGRRDALKRVAVGAGVVWTAPKIANLSHAPDYLVAGTGKCSGTFNVAIDLPGNPDSSDANDLTSDFTTNACGPLSFHIDTGYDVHTRRVIITKNATKSAGNNCNIATGNANRTYTGIHKAGNYPDRQPNHSDANDSDIARAYFDSGDDDGNDVVGYGGIANLKITC